MVSKLGFKTSGDGIWIMKSVGQAGRGCGSASRGPGLGSGWIGCQDCDQCGRVRGTYSLLWHCGFHSEVILCSLLYGKIHRPFGLDGWLVVVLIVAPAFNCGHPNCPTTSVCSASRAPKKREDAKGLGVLCRLRAPPDLLRSVSWALFLPTAVYCQDVS